jgi:large subunit ribosomal protein L13
VAVTGKKEEQKQYHTHSAYLGGLKLFKYSAVKAKKPEYVIMQAVKGMLPRNKLSYRMLKRLKVYRAEGHPHTAQQAQTIKL